MQIKRKGRIHSLDSYYELSLFLNSSCTDWEEVKATNVDDLKNPDC